MASSDIVPPNNGRRSIRNISTARAKRSAPRESSSDVFAEDRPRRFRAGVWIVVLLILIGLGFAVSFLFSGASVSIIPKTRAVTVEGTFTISRDSGTLPFEVVTLDRESEESATPQGEEEVSEHATGEIIVYNNFDENTQRLITNTRFETADGKIYRIRKPIIVPGKTSSGPGSIVATVYADEPGEDYNIGVTDFTIPGFEGTPRFNDFYAKSKTAMTGGFEGIKKVLPENEETEVRTRLRSSLENDLRSGVTGQIPETFVSSSEIQFVTFESLPQTSEGDLVILREKGVIHALVFKSKDLATFIAENTLGNLEGSSVDIYDMSNLSIVPIPQEDPLIPIWEQGELDIAVSGSVTLIWEVDAEAVAGSLAGTSKEATDMILSAFPGIDSAHVSVRPFWKSSYPENPAEIDVTLKEPLKGLTQ